MNLYIVGTSVEIDAEFIDQEGNLGDPDNIIAEIIQPDGAILSLTDRVGRRSIGNYFVPFLPTVSGLHQYRVAGYGAFYAANEGAFYAQTSFNYITLMVPPTGALDIESEAGTAEEAIGSRLVIVNEGSLEFVGEEVFKSVALLTPLAAAMAMAGAAPSLVTANIPNIGTGGLSISGASSTTAVQITPGAGSMSVAGASAALSRTFNITPLVGSLAATGAAPVDTTFFTITPLAGALSAAGVAPVQGLLALTQVGSMLFTGAISLQGTVRQPVTGALVLTGTASLTDVHTDVPAANLALTGIAAAMTRANFLTPQTAGLILDGEAGTVGGPPPLFDNANSSSTTLAAALTIPINIGAGANRALIVGVAYADAAAGSASIVSVTYNGVPMTLVPSSLQAAVLSSTYDIGVAHYVLTAPASGTHDIVVTMSESCDFIQAGGTSWTGVHQSTPTNAVAKDTGTGGSPNVDIASAQNEVPIACVLAVDGGAFLCQDTERWRQGGGIGNIISAASSTAGNTLVTMGFLGAGVGLEWVMTTTSLRAAIANPSIPPNTGALTLAGIAASVRRGTVITPSVGSLILTGVAPTLFKQNNIAPTVGSLTAAGIAPVLTRNIGLVQKKQFTSNGTPTATSISVTMDNPVQLGNYLALYACWGNGVGGDFIDVTDTLGNTFNFVNSLGASGDFHLTQYAKVTVAGSDTITVNLNIARGYRSLEVHEITGLLATTPLDQEALVFQASPGTGANGATTGNVTTTTNGQYIFAAIFVDNTLSMTISAGTGYTIRDNFGGGVDAAPFASEDRIQTTAGAIAGTFTLSSNQPCSTAIMTFKAA